MRFFNLPEKHTEPQLHAGIRENIKKFILELGKDFRLCPEVSMWSRFGIIRL